MAHVHADRVRDTTATTGTGAVTLAGAPPNGYRTFSVVCSVNDTCWYCIEDPATGDWETGKGTYSATNTLTRTSVKQSSNSNSAVSFGSGSKNVFMTPIAFAFPASVLPFLAADVAATISAGFKFTPFSAGTKSSGTFTPNASSGNRQYVTNGGAHTIAAPADDSELELWYTNNGSAGSITFSGFTVSSNVGDTLDTTNTHKFIIVIKRVNSVATYFAKALQ